VRSTLGGEELDLCAEQVDQLEGLERQREIPFLDPLQVEEVVDQIRQSFRLPVNRRDIPAARFGVDVAIDKELGKADDAGERRPELV